MARKMMPRRRDPRGTHGSRRTDEIIANGWTRAQCRAIELSLGGGFLAMAVLEVIFKW